MIGTFLLDLSRLVAQLLRLRVLSALLAKYVIKEPCGIGYSNGRLGRKTIYNVKGFLALLSDGRAAAKVIGRWLHGDEGAVVRRA